MRVVRAFFCENEYYLLPDGYTENGLPDSGVLSVLRLKTENCAPPDFIENEWEETEFFFGLQPVFFVDAYLRSQEEYREILESNEAQNCLDCIFYERQKRGEINCRTALPLNGGCYRKRTEQGLSFGEKALAFLSRFAEALDEIQRLYDSGEQKQAEKKIKELLAEFFLPLDPYLQRDENGNFILCFSGNLFSAEGLSVVLKALADAFNEEGSLLNKKGWKMYPFYPKDIFQPKLKPDYIKKPPKLFYSVDGETGDIVIAVYEKGAEDWSEKVAKRKNEALYKYLCFALGEDVILAGTHTVKICGEIPTDKTEVSADELDKILRSHVKELYGEYPFPAPFFLQPTTDGNDCFYPYKENPKGWATICPEFAPDYFVPFEGENEEELPLNAFMKFMTGGGMFEALGIGYAYVYLPVEEEFPYEKREVLEDWLIDYLKKTNEPGREFVLKV
ncbi:MAG: hypothetical protein IIX01_01005, partial [Clostridia bacterium]|nr:hypothetical protein [Clostridia bacterium]